MDAILSAIAARADATHLVLLVVIGLQQWQLRERDRAARDWAAAMDRLAETLTALRLALAVRRGD